MRLKVNVVDSNFYHNSQNGGQMDWTLLLVYIPGKKAIFSEI